MTAGEYTSEFANGTIPGFTTIKDPQIRENEKGGSLGFDKTQVRTDLGGRLTGSALDEYLKEQDALFMSQHPDLYTREIPEVVKSIRARRSKTQPKLSRTAA